MVVNCRECSGAICGVIVSGVVSANVDGCGQEGIESHTVDRGMLLIRDVRKWMISGQSQLR